METYRYPQFPPELATVYAALFTDVQNAAELKTRLVSASVMPGNEGDVEREAVNFAFVDARLVTSVLHLQTAIYHAILAATQDSLRTKTVHSEVLWTLNPSNNISEAFRRYGVTDDSKALFVIRIDKDVSDIVPKMQAAVKGTVAPLSSLSNITDWAAVNKYHKLNNELAVREHARDPARERVIVDEIVISSVAMKSVQA
ncbi:CGI-121-domain-containing protein [Phanerochaete sordida]|uniref:EKC/KEOPS complex subunit CGI121 n=1 Tax=Phanerochaete sordida TaxID=48140 RepID=A0A9P3L6K8_9APHY|nr:CGI-121-domain-containing protein [Phanerochaete sordida]